jgi:hypothetical protein
VKKCIKTINDKNLKSLPSFAKKDDNRARGGNYMIVTQKELSHLIFLTDVVMNGKKKIMMEETLHCLMYIVKSIQEIDLPDNVVEQIQLHIEKIEDQLRSENDRLQEINHNLSNPSKRKPLG